MSESKNGNMDTTSKEKHTTDDVEYLQNELVAALRVLTKTSLEVVNYSSSSVDIIPLKENPEARTSENKAETEVSSENFATERETLKMDSKHYSKASVITTRKAAHNILDTMPVLQKTKASHKVEEFMLKERSIIPEMCIYPNDSSDKVENENNYIESTFQELSFSDKTVDIIREATNITNSSASTIEFNKLKEVVKYNNDPISIKHTVDVTSAASCQSIELYNIDDEKDAVFVAGPSRIIENKIIQTLEDSTIVDVNEISSFRKLKENGEECTHENLENCAAPVINYRDVAIEANQFKKDVAINYVIENDSKMNEECVREVPPIELSITLLKNVRQLLKLTMRKEEVRYPEDEPIHIKPKSAKELAAGDHLARQAEDTTSVEKSGDKLAESESTSLFRQLIAKTFKSNNDKNSDNLPSDKDENEIQSQAEISGNVIDLSEKASGGLWDNFKVMLKFLVTKQDTESILDEENKIEHSSSLSEKSFASHSRESSVITQPKILGSTTEMKEEPVGLWDTLKTLVKLPQMTLKTEFVDKEFQIDNIMDDPFEKSAQKRNVKFGMTSPPMTSTVDIDPSSFNILPDKISRKKTSSSASKEMIAGVRMPKVNELVLFKADVPKVIPTESFESTAPTADEKSTKFKTRNRAARPRRNTQQKTVKKPTVDAAVQTEDLLNFRDELQNLMCECHLGPDKLNETGMFSDGERRTDMVLVMRNVRDKPEVEAAKLNYLERLVKAGVQIEAEAGRVRKNLIFLKLHATDPLLDFYGDTFGARKRFRQSHETYISNRNAYNWLFMFTSEREWIRSIRDTYNRPLQMSNHDRSYVLYMLLLYNKFGDRPNQFGLQRLMNKNIVVDAYSLHDGPYQLPLGKDNFNARQILYTNWAGFANILWSQPKYLLHEYFGPKVAFFFTFYELCNRLLLAMGLWGSLMMFLYTTKDYLKTLRNELCEGAKTYNLSKTPLNIDNKDLPLRWFYMGTPCAECEGTKNLTLCPYTLVQNYCFDLKVMRYFENPFLLPYSAGMAILGVIFLVNWRRAEAFWVWVTEEDNEPSSGRYLVRPNYKTYPKCSWRDFSSWPPVIFNRAWRFMLTLIVGVLLPISVIIIPFVLVFIAYVLGYEGTRVWSVKSANLWGTDSRLQGQKIVTQMIDKHMEFATIMAVAVVLHIVLYIMEQVLHIISYFVAKMENHKTFGSYEDNLILSYSWFSFHCIIPVLLYFSVLKGAFYYTPISNWDVVFNITSLWSNKTYSYNMTALLKENYSELLRRAFTLNCIYFGCFRQAVAVYAIVLVYRVFLVEICLIILRRLKIFVVEMLYLLYSWAFSCCKSQSASEREFMLPSVSHRELMLSYNRLITQMIVVVLFAPLFPPAPLLAFIINVFDLRDKAHIYLVHSRRALMEKSRGIGAWNQQIKFVLLAIPLFHGMIIARTVVFEEFEYQRAKDRDRNKNLSMMDYFFKTEYSVLSVAKNHKRFHDINLDRIGKQRAPDLFNNNMIFYAFIRKFNQHSGFALNNCKVFGHRLNASGIEAKQWPYSTNIIAENYSMSAAAPDHYEWMFMKSLYVAALLLFVVVATAILMRCIGEYSSSVERTRARERQLRRLHLPLRARLNTRGAGGVAGGAEQQTLPVTMTKPAT